MVHNVVLLLRDLIWFLDNSMGTFIELAGGTACFPTFTCKIGQPEEFDVIHQQLLWDDFDHKKRAPQNYINTNVHVLF